jgi:peroxiredoxin
MVDSNSLGFDILTDPNNDYAHALGLRFELPEQLRPIYLGLGIDLPACNGDQSWTLPMPARIIVGSDGIVLDVNADPDYTRRPEPSETLELLKQLVN